MPPIRDEGDMYRNNLHWSAQDAMSRSIRRPTWQRTQQVKHGQDWQVDTPVVVSFWNTVRAAWQAALSWAFGRPAGRINAPLAPELPSSQRFTTLGIVNIEAPDLGESGQPMKTQLPFQQQTPVIPTQEQLNDNLSQFLQDVGDPGAYQSPEARKRRQRAAYMRQRGREVDYTITPLMIFRHA